ncbi:hypothetical protein ACROYT_G019721 [Oculina patagonica]
MALRVAAFTAYGLLFSVFISAAYSCPEGYYGSPCQVRHCETLMAPSNAVMGDCSTEYSSVCHMKCNEGYEPVGSIERRCEVTADDVMAWSGIPLSCVVITCPFLYVPYADPPTGDCTWPSGAPQHEITYNTRCTYTCLSGYQLKGCKERVCQLDKTWSGKSTSCEQIYCPALSLVQPGVTLSPSSCAAGPVVVHWVCIFSCPHGYTLNINYPEVVSYALQCLPNGTWTESIPTCHDVESPTLTCPGPALYVDTHPGKATATVVWSVQVNDNSVDVDSNAVIQVQSSHQSGQEFPIGGTVVKITATDEAGNVATCSFHVEVRDIEPPSCSSCPADIVQEVTTLEERVNWDRPNCSDNSGVPPTFTSNFQNGQLFRVPSSNLVQYTVSDGVNVNQDCSFRITLKVKSCPSFSPPQNGALACTNWDANYPTCAVLCKNGTDFEFNPPLFYYCDQGEWKFYVIPGQPYEQKTPGPNCSGSANTSWMKMADLVSWHYYFDGDAHDPSDQEDIKTKFHSLLISNYVPFFFCKAIPDCTKENILVSLGVIG